ncbi:hypothetical protein ACRRVA_03470 [Candidatus Cardinium hertigii]|uniref:hypothetical protein n=1 Tax=Candidatus Cardinium hertigii TaxID=247481 RepID=UPI003D7E2923
MAYKFNTLKCIKKGLIGPNILFPAAYILFSAEVCTGGAKNKPVDRMQQVLRTALPVNSVDQLDMKKNLESAEGKALEAAESVDPSDKIAEDLEGSEGSTEGLEAGESVDPSDKIAEDLEGSESSTEGLEAGESVDQPKVDTKPVPLAEGAPAEVGVGTPAAPPLAAGPLPPPPPPPMPNLETVSRSLPLRTPNSKASDNKDQQGGNGRLSFGDVKDNDVFKRQQQKNNPEGYQENNVNTTNPAQIGDHKSESGSHSNQQNQLLPGNQ